jgi:predicted Rossmann fold nucleotide-binding protein DprA/Smf involved in DNA uptake
VTSTSDVLFTLGIDHSASKTAPTGSNEAEQAIIDLLAQGVSEGAVLQIKSSLTIEQFNQHLTMLEITGKIRSTGANHWTLA